MLNLFNSDKRMIESTSKTKMIQNQMYDEKYLDQKLKLRNTKGGRGKKKKGRKKKIKQEFLQDKVDEQANMEKVCRLCMREQPIYFYGTEDHVKSLPDRVLTPLLRDLKQDMENKASYLRYLKVSAKHCQPCSCIGDLHQYCITAQVIRSRRIYCNRCGEAFNLVVKREKACTGKFMTLLIKYFLLTLCMVGCAVGYLMLDAYVKTSFAKWRVDLEQEGEKIREFQNLNDKFYI